MTKNQKANLALGTIVVTICLFAALYLWPSFEGPMNVSPPTEPETQAHTPSSSRSGEPAHTFDNLLDAIEWVESRGDPWAVGDNGNAVGAYQIHKIYVDDVNRIQKSYNTPMLMRRDGQFTYRDRENKQRSREMVTIYLNHYGGTFEEMARKQNGGPQGHKKESTKAYWLKVKARMEAK